jgi:hypothetical protein
MNEISFAVATFRPVGDEVGWSAVHISIDGRSLVDVLREVERPFADAEGFPEIAGSYAGLPAEVALPPSRLFLGEPDEVLQDGERTQILGCTCGAWGCWPLLTRISVSPDRVVWSDFANPHRGPDSRASHWRYESVGPFEFSRAAYEAELLRAAQVLQ